MSTTTSTESGALWTAFTFMLIAGIYGSVSVRGILPAITVAHPATSTAVHVSTAVPWVGCLVQFIMALRLAGHLGNTWLLTSDIDLFSWIRFFAWALNGSICVFVARRFIGSTLTAKTVALVFMTWIGAAAGLAASSSAATATSAAATSAAGSWPLFALWMMCTMIIAYALAEGAAISSLQIRHEKDTLERRMAIVMTIMCIGVWLCYHGLWILAVGTTLISSHPDVIACILTILDIIYFAVLPFIIAGAGEVTQGRRHAPAAMFVRACITRGMPSDGQGKGGTAPPTTAAAGAEAAQTDTVLSVAPSSAPTSASEGPSGQLGTVPGGATASETSPAQALAGTTAPAVDVSVTVANAADGGADATAPSFSSSPGGLPSQSSSPSQTMPLTPQASMMARQLSVRSAERSRFAGQDQSADHEAQQGTDGHSDPNGTTMHGSADRADHRIYREPGLPATDAVAASDAAAAGTSPERIQAQHLVHQLSLHGFTAGTPAPGISNAGNSDDQAALMLGRLVMQMATPPSPEKGSVAPDLSAVGGFGDSRIASGAPPSAPSTSAAASASGDSALQMQRTFEQLMLQMAAARGGGADGAASTQQPSSSPPSSSVPRSIDAVSAHSRSPAVGSPGTARRLRQASPSPGSAASRASNGGLPLTVTRAVGGRVSSVTYPAPTASPPAPAPAKRSPSVPVSNRTCGAAASARAQSQSPPERRHSRGYSDDGTSANTTTNNSVNGDDDDESIVDTDLPLPLSQSAPVRIVFAPRPKLNNSRTSSNNGNGSGSKSSNTANAGTAANSTQANRGRGGREDPAGSVGADHETSDASSVGSGASTGLKRPGFAAGAAKSRNRTANSPRAGTAGSPLAAAASASSSASSRLARSPTAAAAAVGASKLAAGRDQRRARAGASRSPGPAVGRARSTAIPHPVPSTSSSIPVLASSRRVVQGPTPQHLPPPPPPSAASVYGVGQAAAVRPSSPYRGQLQKQQQPSYSQHNLALQQMSEDAQLPSTSSLSPRQATTPRSSKMVTVTTGPSGGFNSHSRSTGTSGAGQLSPPMTGTSTLIPVPAPVPVSVLLGDASPTTSSSSPARRHHAYVHDPSQQQPAMLNSGAVAVGDASAENGRTASRARVRVLS